LETLETLMTYILFFIFTILVILTVEKLSQKFVGLIFKKDLKEMEEEQEKLIEYHELSLLAIAMNDKLAYKGFNEMMNEIYWKLFFRQLIITTTLFFLLLSPYMYFSGFLFNKIQNSFSLVFAVAIIYFMSKNVYGYAREILELRKEVRLIESRFEE